MQKEYYLAKSPFRWQVNSEIKCRKNFSHVYLQLLLIICTSSPIERLITTMYLNTIRPPFCKHMRGLPFFMPLKSLCVTDLTKSDSLKTLLMMLMMQMH